MFTSIEVKKGYLLIILDITDSFIAADVELSVFKIMDGQHGSYRIIHVKKVAIGVERIILPWSGYAQVTVS